MRIFWETTRAESPDADELTEWRAAAWRVADAWEAWRVARGCERDRAHAAYLAALADEELAALRLQELALEHQT